MKSGQNAARLYDTKGSYPITRTRYCKKGVLRKNGGWFRKKRLAIREIAVLSGHRRRFDGQNAAQRAVNHHADQLVDGGFRDSTAQGRLHIVRVA